MLVLDKTKFEQVGVVGRTHGLDGYLFISYLAVFPEDLDSIDYLFILQDGLLVPFPLIEMEFKTKDQALIKLDFINSKDEARNLLGSEIFLPKNQLVEQTQNIDLEHYIGYSIIIDQDILIGIISNYLDIPNNPLFELQYLGKEILIPAQTPFIQEVDQDKRIIYMILPEGLLDLFLEDPSKDDE